MKKTIIFSIVFLTLCFFLITISSTAYAVYPENQFWELGGLRYVLDGTQLTVSGSGPMIECTKSDTYLWHKYSNSIQYVTIEDGVTRISGNAFYNFDKLRSITIHGNSLRSIGDCAFYDCDLLTSIIIPDGTLSIGNKAFYDCDSLKSIIIPDGTLSIGNEAFLSCDELSYIKIPGSIDTIGSAAFFCSGDKITSAGPIGSGCNCQFGWNTTIPSNFFGYFKNLVSITLPKGVENIDDYAFSSCSGLTDIYIPSSVKRIGYHAFPESDSFTDIYFNGTEEQWEILKAGTYLSGDVSIHCVFLTSLPSCLPTLDNWSYRCIKKDKEFAAAGEPVTITVFSVSEADFDSLSLYYYDNNGDVQTIVPVPEEENNAKFVFLMPPYDITINIQSKWGNLHWKYENGVLTISGKGDMDSFEGYDYFKWRDMDINRVVIGNEITSIGDEAFSGLPNLNSVSLPDSITRIGDRAFYDCSLKSIILPDAVTEIGEAAFSNSWITEISIPSGVDKISYECFKECFNLKKIIISDTVTLLSSYSFEDCSSLEEIIMPESLLYIGYGAFRGCSSLKSLILPNNVNDIYGSSFENCTSLTSIHLSNSVTYIGEYAFSGCANLESIVIPNSITYIGKYAFTMCSSLTNVILSSGMTEIMFRCFRKCSNLTSITIPSSITYIEDYAFEYCPSLKDVFFLGTEKQWNDIKKNAGNNRVINAALHFVENDLFDVILDSKICGSIIADKDKAYEEEIVTLTVSPDTVFDWINISFTDLNNTGTTQSISISQHPIEDFIYTFTMPKENVFITVTFQSRIWDNLQWSYKNGLLTISGTGEMTGFSQMDKTSAWHVFSSMIEKAVIQDGVTSIGAFAFDNCSSLSEITIPASITEIEESAFEGCAALSNIHVQCCSSGEQWAENSGFNFSVCHGWGDAHYSWAEDYSTLTASRVCVKDSSHTEAETVNVNYEIIQSPSEDKPGAYNLKHGEFHNPVFEKQERFNIEIPALGEMSTMILPKGVKVIEEEAFSGISCQAVVIPYGCTDICENAFANCRQLMYVLLPDSIQYISPHAFQGCGLVIIDRQP